MSETAQTRSNDTWRMRFLWALALTACMVLWVCAGLGIPITTFAAIEALNPREEIAALLMLSILPLELGVFVATVVGIRWLNLRSVRSYFHLLDDVFARLEMTGEPLEDGGRLWKRDGVWVSLSSKRFFSGIPTRPRRHLEVAVTTPQSFEAEFYPSVPILLPATCARPPRPSFTGDPQAARWLDDERLIRVLYALPFGGSRIRVHASGVVWHFTAARAGLQPDHLSEANLQRWLDDLAGLSEHWAADCDGGPTGLA